ncbi:hypothetical protein, conserved [Entamoeba dispar SAW760]|uniref:Leucine rich repeat containing protein BspA family protein n=1 Tax=Entamoeba dispar (strain ATCC PRA-260 / SAW760) TaxID=370354 RepID=B0ERE0_ENTDS|nr:uncharacterized protein EDI_320260 [Entamoeba dispar SAW760]EDR22907.1 hypothetical protein, conserved [Entamoeba dispar SAW760]|eukprot:EDR22907.1 hypothetical protein, conserved [Entamoeba dispar SAW760]
MRIGYNEIMITSKYFNDINDFINLEIGIKRFQGNMERFHFNPIPLNEHSRKLFPNIETFHIYNYNDKTFKDGRIFKYVIWNTVDYSKYLQEKEQGNICKNIEYTLCDRIKYGNTIPSEVKSLRHDCFYKCSSLTTINIPSSIIKIGHWCFKECYSLTSISIDNLQFIIEGRIFMNEPVLISCEIPYNLQTINGKNIEKKDINEFIIPSSITKLGDWCFCYCYSLTSIIIPSSVIKLGYRCFFYMFKIGNECFYDCKSLTSINIPSSIKSFGRGCFYGCYSLKSINIPSSISKIGNYCFESCKSLISINIPSSITAFGDVCFCECGCVEELKKNERIPRNCFDECC